MISIVQEVVHFKSKEVIVGELSDFSSKAFTESVHFWKISKESTEFNKESIDHKISQIVPNSLRWHFWQDKSVGTFWWRRGFNKVIEIISEDFLVKFRLLFDNNSDGLWRIESDDLVNFDWCGSEIGSA